MSQLQELVSDIVASPLGDVIAAVGRGVADAQAALDEGSLAQTLALYSEGGDAALQLLREIGYQPTFYTLPETIGEVKVALKLAGGYEQSAVAPAQTNPLNAITQPSTAVNPATATSATSVANLAASVRAAQLSSARVEALAKLPKAAAASVATKDPSLKNTTAATSAAATATSALTSATLQQALAASRAARAKLYATPVDASYANRFNFSAEVSAKLTFKIVPVPPPQGIEDIRIVPALVGVNLADALARLSALNLVAEVVMIDGGQTTPWDEAKDPSTFSVIVQAPADTPLLRAGQTVTLSVQSY